MTPHPDADLTALAGQDAEARLFAKLRDLRALVDEIESREVEAGLDPDTEAAMRARCTADDAPLGWRSLRDRVERGTLTWPEIWHRPYAVGPEATSLVRAVMPEGWRS